MMESEVKTPNPAERPQDKNEAPELDSAEHGKKLAEWLEWLEYSAQGKRTIEREGLVAMRHYTAWLDEKRHPFPTKTYDPVYFSSRVARKSKAVEAIYASPPIHEFMPRGMSDHDTARIMTHLLDYHHNETRPRAQIEEQLDQLGDVGTAFGHVYWDYEERVCGYWQRVPMEVNSIDPLTGQPISWWIDDGNYKWVRKRKVIKDSPRFKSLSIWQCFPDDTVTEIQDGLFFIFLDHISAATARQRIKTDGWRKEAVECALKMGGYDNESGVTALTGIMDRLKWMQELGLRSDHISDAFRTKDGTKAVEVMEVWYREGDELRRAVVLNRMAIAKDGPNPYGHGLFPFTKSVNYRLAGQFWGMSDYHVIRWLNRGIQTMRNAGLTEALIAAMPPLLMGAGLKLTGMRWEPGAQWNYDGDVSQLKWFESSGRAIRASEEHAQSLMQQMDRAMGSSDINRGIASSTKGVAATNVNLAFESAGMKEKLFIGNFGDQCLEPWADMARQCCQQFQEYEVQLRLDGPKSPPITVYPEHYRDADLYAVPTAATSSTKHLHEKRLQDLYQLATQEPNANRRNAWELLVEAIAPYEKSNIVLSEEEIQQQQQAQMQQQAQQMGLGGVGGQMPGPGQLPDGGYETGTNEMAAELAAAMGAA